MKTLEEKREYCMSITKEAIEKAEAVDEAGELLLKWAKDYYKDAEYYNGKDEATALEAVAYAHGFIDAGVLLGHLKIKDYHLEGVLKK